MIQLLLLCSDEKKWKRKSHLNETKGLEDVKNKIKKLHEERKIEEEITTIGTENPNKEGDKATYI